MHDQIDCNKRSPTGSLTPAVPLAITPTFRPCTHTSDDSYIYQLSLVVATATVSFLFLVRYTLPRLWHSSAYFLLYCCCTAVVLFSYTQCGFVGCWMLFFCCVLCFTSAVLRTAVVLLLYGVAGWNCSWVCPWVRGFFSYYTGPALA